MLQKKKITVNRHAKILNKILVNQIQLYIKMLIHDLLGFYGFNNKLLQIYPLKQHKCIERVNS